MLRAIVPLYAACIALSLARSTQAERDNVSYFFVRAADVHRFIIRYHAKKLDDMGVMIEFIDPLHGRYSH